MRRSVIALFLLMALSACAGAAGASAAGTTIAPTAAHAPVGKTSTHAFTGPILPITLAAEGMDWRVYGMRYMNDGGGQAMEIAIRGSERGGDGLIALLAPAADGSGPTDAAQYVAAMHRDASDPQNGLTVSPSWSAGGGSGFRYENPGKREHGLVYARMLEGEGEPMILTFHVTWSSEGKASDPTFIEAMTRMMGSVRRTSADAMPATATDRQRQIIIQVEPPTDDTQETP